MIFDKFKIFDWHLVAKVITESFVLFYGIWTLSSNLAVMIQLPFRFLWIPFFCLLSLFSIFFLKTGFFKDWSNSEITAVEVNQDRGWKLKFLSIAIGILILFSIFYTLIGHKPDLDDAHYIRISVDMADHPEKPLLHLDPLGLSKGFPLIITVYKAHSIESFFAAISKISGIKVIYLFHFFLPVVGAILMVLAYIVLFRVLLPGREILATLILFFLLFLMFPKPFGDFTFLRMHQGKGILFSAVLPLIIAYGIRASIENKRKYWILLAFTQIVAMGLNSTGLWLAPIVANLSVISGSLASKPKRIFFNLGFGILTSVYVLIFGLYIAINFKLPPFYIAQNIGNTELILFSLQRVFGQGIVGYLSVGIIFISWVFAPNRLTRIILIVFPLFTLLIFLNPFTAGFIATHFVSFINFWRTIWVIPFCLMIGIIGIYPFISDSHSKIYYFKTTTAAVIILLFVISTINTGNFMGKRAGAEFKLPGLKVNKEYWVAEKIKYLTTENDVLLSPNLISSWISTMHHHPETVIYRDMITESDIFQYSRFLLHSDTSDLSKFMDWAKWYKPDGYVYPYNSRLTETVRQLKNDTGIALFEIFNDYEFQLLLKEYISGTSKEPLSDEAFTEGLLRYGVTAVCFPDKNIWMPEIVRVLKSNNYLITHKFENFQLWMKNK